MQPPLRDSPGELTQLENRAKDQIKKMKARRKRGFLSLDGHEGLRKEVLKESLKEYLRVSQSKG